MSSPPTRPITRTGPVEWFTGSVWADEIAAPPSPSRLRAYLVRFAPDARTAWHEHPCGQALYVTEGTGLIQRAGSPVEEIHAGDCVWFAPGERHWHGAAPTSYFAHIAMQEVDQLGSTATWHEHVNDAQPT